MAQAPEQNLLPDSSISIFIRTPQGERLLADATGWTAELHEEEWSGPGKKFRVRAYWNGTTTVQAGLLVRYPLNKTRAYRILIPSVFYGDNGLGSNTTHYPRLGPLDKAAFTALGWDFASNRTALPAVFAQSETEMRWLAVEPNGTGAGFSLEEKFEELRVHYPGLQLPFRYDRANESPSEPFLEIAPGGILELTFWDGLESSPVPAAYAQVQRALQTAWGSAASRSIEPDLARAAADAAVYGLLNWHYHPLEVQGSRFNTPSGAGVQGADSGLETLDSPLETPSGMLFETVSFDLSQVREDMHVAWVSGTPTAYALLKYGLNNQDEIAANAARGVLNKVGSGLAPCGAFWGLWSQARGWRAGWNGHPEKLHARTLSEAALFLIRALALESEHPDWGGAVRSNLDFCLRCLDERGNPGSYYNALSGEVWDRRGTAGLLWAAALAEGSTLFNESNYAEGAVKIGEFYTEAVLNGELLGAPEDIGLCPSSEDGYNAVIAMMALYNLTGEKRWLELAKVAADWTFTFRWSYDVQFPAGSPLERRGFRTRGADSASPSNIHLHDYGLICQPELLQLSQLLNDPWYAARAADHLACFLGEVALRNGEFGGPERRGMMNEQWYTANWSLEGRAGEVGPISHAWCLGLLLYAAEDWLERATVDSQPKLFFG